MKFEASKNATVEGSSIGSVQKYRANTGVLISILRDKLYNFKLRTPIQEYMSNARDAHSEVGNDHLPIEITLPTKIRPEIMIRDFGPGLSEERVNDVFCVYGESTKRQTDAIGGFGIGGKSAFAYTNAFSITSYYNGFKTVYLSESDSSPEGTLRKISQSNTDEPNGVCISIPIKDQDLKIAENAVLRSALFWEVQPKIINADDSFKWPKVKHYEDFVVVDNSEIKNIIKPDSIYIVKNIPYENTAITSKDIFQNYKSQYHNYDEMPNVFKNQKDKTYILKLDSKITHINPNRESLEGVDDNVTGVINAHQKILQERTTEINKIAAIEDPYLKLKSYNQSAYETDRKLVINQDVVIDGQHINFSTKIDEKGNPVYAGFIYFVDQNKSGFILRKNGAFSPYNIDSIKIINPNTETKLKQTDIRNTVMKDVDLRLGCYYILPDKETFHILKNEFKTIDIQIINKSHKEKIEKIINVNKKNKEIIYARIKNYDNNGKVEITANYDPQCGKPLVLADDKVFEDHCLKFTNVYLMNITPRKSQKKEIEKALTCGIHMKDYISDVSQDKIILNNFMHYAVYKHKHILYLEQFKSVVKPEYDNYISKSTLEHYNKADRYFDDLYKTIKDKKPFLYTAIFENGSYSNEKKIINLLRSDPENHKIINDIIDEFVKENPIENITKYKSKRVAKKEDDEDSVFDDE